MTVTFYHLLLSSVMSWCLTFVYLLYAPKQGELLICVQYDQQEEAEETSGTAAETCGLQPQCVR